LDALAVAAVLLGWPAVCLSLGLAAVGIVGARWRLVALAGIAAMPFALYLSATPRFRLAAPLALVLFAGAAGATARGWRAAAAELLVPVAAVVAIMLDLALR
jgi:hypothetical protein